MSDKAIIYCRGRFAPRYNYKLWRLWSDSLCIYGFLVITFNKKKKNKMAASDAYYAAGVTNVRRE